MKKQHGSSQAWCFCYYEAEHLYRGKTTNEATIIIVLKGSMLALLNGYGQTMGAGEMFLMAPDTTYEYRIRERVKVVICNFAPEIPYDIIPSQELVCLKQPSICRIPTLTINQSCYRFLVSIDYYRGMAIGGERMQAIKQQEFFCLLADTYDKEGLAVFFRSVTDERAGFRSFVTGNWQNARNVEELAALLNLSKSGFEKKFRRYFNESPYKWMIGRKAECVLEEIVFGSTPLKEIADRYHFANYAHFGAFCRSQYGFSPKELIKRRKWNVLQNESIERKTISTM